MDSHPGVKNSRTAVILFAHGSSVDEANRGVHELAQKIESAGDCGSVRAAFLGLAQPDLAGAIAGAAAEGANRIIVVPYFLTMGVHLREDMPLLIEAARRRYPVIEIQVGQSLENHPQMPELVLSRIRDAMEPAKVNP